MTLNPDRKLSSETRRLIAILNALATDPMLDLLISLAAGDRISFDAPISVMLDGQLIRGRIAKPEVFAGILDERLKAIAQTATLHLVGAANAEAEGQTRKALVESLSDAFSQDLRVARERERHAKEVLERVWGTPDEHEEDTNPTIDDLPDAEALLALQTLGPRVTLTLDQAELYVPPARWDPIGVVRLSVQHIAGWWMPPIP